jgi:hypothetical protein
MGIPVYFGHKLYGYVDNPDGTQDATRFFHIYYIPLIPFGSFTMTGESQGFKRDGLRLTSVLFTYLKVWGVGLAAILAAVAFSAWPDHGLFVGAALSSLMVASVVIFSWFFLAQPKGGSRTTRMIAFPILWLVLVGGLGSQLWHEATRTHWGGATNPFNGREMSADDMEKAMRALGSMAGALGGTPQASGSSLESWKKGCDAGVWSACNSVGVAYLKGEEGAPKDPKIAATYYDKACNGGEGMACANLGVMYEEGNTLAKDLTRAMALYTKACDDKHGTGCLYAGMNYEKGLGVKKDKKRARGLFRQACELKEQKGCDRAR